MRYNTPEILINKNGQRYFKARKYPPIPPLESDIYVVTVQGDRLDLLAYTYYNDATLWWVISMANNNVTVGSMFPEPGTQLRIPTDLTTVIAIFNNENNI
jgi:nucleoid-associated protein YgaU